MSQRFYKIKGRSLEDAYRIMREKFGPEALVLSTHEVTEGGLLGLFGRKMVEITASVPEATVVGRPRSAIERKYQAHSAPPPENAAGPLKEYEELIRNAQRRMNAQKPPPPAPASPVAAASPPPEVATARAGGSPVLPFPKRSPEIEAGPDLKREMQEIREIMQVLYAESPGAGLPAEFAPHYRALVNCGVARKVAAALIGAVLKNSDLSVIRDPRIFGERLQLEIRRIVPTTGGIALHGGHCRLVALCGATGVGKTTNLAKLAAQFAVHERARVALITSDTYRVAAAEQLRVYANIIGLTLRVCNDGKETAEAVRDLRDYDLVLMDTAGGSQFNLEQINDLKGMLQAARPQETMLVMSAGTQLDDLRNAISNFKCLNPTSVLFTKIDETRQYGAMLSLLVESGLPLSYLSVGQNVPDDIRVATPGMVANLVLEGRNGRG